MLRREDGFTLVELLIVISIIGVLVSIAIVSFVVSVSASKKTVCDANIRTIRDQIEVYYVRFEDYPPTLQDLVPEFLESVDCLFCPDSGEAYIYDEDTGRVSCPFHAE